MIEYIVVGGLVLSLLIYVVKLIFKVNEVQKINSDVMLYCEEGNEEKVLELLPKLPQGGTLDGRNANGHNIIQICAIKNLPNVLEALSTTVNEKKTINQKGLHIDDKDNNGWSALHHSCEIGNAEATKKLIELGADVNIQNDGGWTPLHFASLRNRHSIKDILLTNKADESIRTRIGQTAFEIQEEVVKYCYRRK